MRVSREQFAQGMTAEQFIDSMEVNRERFEANIAAAEDLITDEDRRAFGARPLSILAIGEDWCTDVVQFLPVVIKLAAQVPSITLRIFPRDQHLDIMDQYLKEGKYRSIPVFVAFDEDWNELGYYLERPAKATEEMAKETRRFAAENPHLEGANRSYENMPEETRKLVFENSARYRWANMERWNRMFLDELREMIAPASAASEAAGE